MILLDDVIYLGDRGGDEKGKDESGDVMVLGPNGDEDGVEDGEERNLQEIPSITTAFA